MQCFHYQSAVHCLIIAIKIDLTTSPIFGGQTFRPLSTFVLSLLLAFELCFLSVPLKTPVEKSKCLANTVSKNLGLVIKYVLAMIVPVIKYVLAMIVPSDSGIFGLSHHSCMWANNGFLIQVFCVMYTCGYICTTSTTATIVAERCMKPIQALP